jgi:hypothetical protein
MVEFLGFLFGLLVIAAAGLAFISHERWKTIRSAYDQDGARRSSGGNALIWPSP